MRFGFAVSSPSGAAVSKPTKARNAKTIPWKIPTQPPKPGSALYFGVKVARSLCPEVTIMVRLNATMIVISIAPRITLVSAESLIPRYVRAKRMRLPSIAHKYQGVLIPVRVWKISAAYGPQTSATRGNSSG